MREFWQDPPTKPFRDWRTYLIGLPVLSSALGSGIFMALSFSFTELGAIAESARVRMVIVAAFATAIGSSFGSIGSGIEVYRKAFEKRTEWLDWTSLSLSVAATLGGFMMGFAALLGTTKQWGDVALGGALLLLSALVALDAAGDLIELGGLFAAYNIRYALWVKEERAYNEAHGITEPPSLPQRGDTAGRREFILDALLGEDAPSQPELAKVLSVSPSTIGRDVTALRKAGRLNGRH